MFHVPNVRFSISFLVTSALLIHWPPLAAVTACIGAVVFRRARYVAIGLLSASAVVTLHHYHTGSRTPIEEIADAEVLLTIENGPRVFKRGCGYDGLVSQKDEQSVDLVVIIATDRCDLRPGDRVAGFGQLRPFQRRQFPDLRSDRARWRERGYDGSLRLSEVLSTDNLRTHSIRRALQTRRFHLIQSMRGANADGVLIAMVTGDRGLIKDETTDGFRAFGLSHLIAISGLHFGVLAAVVWFLMGRLVNRCSWILLTFTRRRAAGFFVVAMMFLFLLFVGAPASATRAFIMLTVYVGSMLFLRDVSPAIALLHAAVVAVALHPFWLVDIGFQFSFAAVTAILLVLAGAPPRVTDAKGRLLTFLRVSSAASFGTWPVALAHFGYVSWIGPLANLLIVPIFSAVLFPLLLVAVACLNLPLVGAAGSEVIEFLSFLVRCVPPWPAAFITTGAIHPATAAACFLLGAGLVVKRQTLRPIVLLLFSSAIPVLVWLGAPSSPEHLTVHFIPVGQGDATLVQYETGETMLIDAGGSLGRDPGHRIVVPYLRRLGIGRLDAVVETHSDLDHAGGIPAVTRNLRVRAVVRRASDAPTFPGTTFLQREIGSANDRSVITQIDSGDLCVLLPGDIEEETEMWLSHQSVCATVLKVAHHGSKTSTTRPFVQRVQPQFAIISAGAANRFGHPHATVVERLQNAGAQVYELSNHGLVTFQIVGESVVVTRAR